MVCGPPHAQPERGTRARSDINPTNPSNIAGAYQDRWDNGGARGLVSAWTKDGGATWHDVVIPGITRCSGGIYDRASDPWVSFAPNGDLYSLSLTFDAFETHNAIIVNKSTNGGESWGPPLEVTADDTNGLDKQAFTPTVKVAADGTVGVTYYDLRNNTPAPGLPTDYWLVRCSATCTNTRSWSEVHVAGSFDEEQAAFAGGYFLGDYEGMTTVGTTFQPFFIQAVSRAAGNPSDVCFSTVP